MLFAGKRIAALEEALRSLKRQVEERDLDWVDMRSRCRRLLDRTEKAARRLAGEELESPGTQLLQPQNGGDAASTAGRVLSAHQMEIQQQVLRRRAGMKS